MREGRVEVKPVHDPASRSRVKERGLSTKDHSKHAVMQSSGSLACQVQHALKPQSLE